MPGKRQTVEPASEAKAFKPYTERGYDDESVGDNLSIDLSDALRGVRPARVHNGRFRVQTEAITGDSSTAVHGRPAHKLSISGQRLAPTLSPPGRQVFGAHFSTDFSRQLLPVEELLLAEVRCLSGLAQPPVKDRALESTRHTPSGLAWIVRLHGIMAISSTRTRLSIASPPTATWLAIAPF